MPKGRGENGADSDGQWSYHILNHIFKQIQSGCGQCTDADAERIILDVGNGVESVRKWNKFIGCYVCMQPI